MRAENDGIDPVLMAFITETDKLRLVSTEETEEQTQRLLEDFIDETDRLYPGRCAFCAEPKEQCICPYEFGVMR